MELRGWPPRRIRAIIGAVVCLLMIGGGLVWWFQHHRPMSFVAVAATRAKLINGIESYVRVNDFLADLARRSIEYEVNRPQSTPADTRRPPFEITAVTIRRFSHLGHVGLLTVAFFNDRLLGVRFFPSDVEGYLAQLRSQEAIDLRSQAEVNPSEHTRVYAATEHQQGRYVGWEDTRLVAEMSLWIKRYS